MTIHEAPPASDALGSPRRMDFQGVVSLVLFIAVLVFFAGVASGKIDGSVVFNLVRDVISLLGGLVTKLAG